MSIHVGKTKYPAVLRFHRGTLRAKGYRDTEIYHQHALRWWLGVSFAGKWFVGFMRFERQEEAREPGKRYGHDGHTPGDA